MTDQEMVDEFKQIQIEQPIEYIFASFLKLIFNKTRMTRDDQKEFLEAVKGGWY